MAATTATLLVLDSQRVGHVNVSASGTGAAPATDLTTASLVLSAGSVVTLGPAGASDYSVTGQTLDVYAGGQLICRIAMSTAVASALGTALSTPAASNYP